jgi:hypothetical protein
MEYTAAMVWSKEQKETLRKAVSQVTATQLRATDLEEFTGVPAKAIRQFMSSGHLGDEKAELLARYLEDRGLLNGNVRNPLPAGTPDIVAEIISDAETLAGIMRLESSLPSRLSAARGVATPLLAKIERHLESLRGSLLLSEEQ